MVDQGKKKSQTKRRTKGRRKRSSETNFKGKKDDQ